VIEAIRRLVGPALAVLDPAPAVARHLGEQLAAAGLLCGGSCRSEHQFFTSADPRACDHAVARLVGSRCLSQPLTWREGELHRG
ncbi:MAG: glutamate racemase, partial [Cyanobacteriota bacterium]